MNRINLLKIVGKRVLVTRESARSIETFARAALVEGHGEIELDFSGVDGLTPSFFDETLAILEQGAEDSNQPQLSIFVTNTPTELSSKFRAVGRAHNLTMENLEDGTWLINRSQ